jgi:hypothetical protein
MKGSAMTVVIEQRRKIDRMKITVPLNPDQYSVGMSILHGIADVAESKNIKHWRAQYGSRLMLKDGLQSLAQITTGISKTQYRYWQWELWPDHIRRPEHTSAWEDFQSLFHTLAADHDPVYSLDHAMDTGKVSYLEIARDFVGVDKQDLLPWTARTKKGNIWQKGIEKGAIYVGHKDSPRRFVVYDKRRQLIAKGLPCPHPSLVRVEARLKNPGILVKDLDHLEDSFQVLHISSLSKARALSKEKQWQLFIQDASNNGTSMAFPKLSKHYRKIYREQLFECAVKWWS